MASRCRPECPLKGPEVIELAQEGVRPQRTIGGVVSRRVPVGDRDTGVNLLQLLLETVKHFPVPRQEVRGSMYAQPKVRIVNVGELPYDAGISQLLDRPNEALFLIIRHKVVVLSQYAQIIPSHRTRLRAGSPQPYLGSR